MSKKTYRELTPLEALKRLADAGGPIDKIYFPCFGGWYTGVLQGVDLRERCVLPFITNAANYAKCAELIETPAEPWGFDSVPAAPCWLRPKMNLGNDANYTFSVVYKSHVTLRVYGDVGYTELAAEWEHSFDRRTWLPCTK